MSLRIENPKVVAKVQGADPSFNKFQDQLLGVTNNFMRQVSEKLGVMPTFDTASRPKANASASGQVIELKDKDAAALVQVCLPDAKGEYAWVTLGDRAWVDAQIAASAASITAAYTAADVVVTNAYIAAIAAAIAAIPAVTIPVYTTGDFPVADASNRGTFARLKDPANREVLRICLQKADDTYAWVDIIMAPP